MADGTRQRFRVTERDTGARAFFRRLRGLGGLRAKVGIQEPQASSQHSPGLSFVELGTIHEFGAPRANIPQRSFLRSTADKNENKYRRELGNVVGTAIRSQQLGLQRFNMLGEMVRGDVVQRIMAGEITPELSEATKRKRGEEGPPLFDTGAMAGSITSKVGPSR